MVKYLGIDIGGSFIKYGVINENNQLEKSWSKKTKSFQNKDLFYDYLCEDILLSERTIIGVSTAGVVIDGLVVSMASKTLQNMYKTNVNHEMKKRLNGDVYTVNDAEAAGICETKLGSAKQARSSVFWIIGTGIGGALFQGEDRIMGIDGISGEFSHIPYKKEHNSLRGIGSELAVIGLINRYKELSGNSLDIDGKFIFNEYEKGNTFAISAMNNWCEKIVESLLMITYFYNPEVICIGGAVSKRKWFIKKLQDFFDQYEYAMKDLISTKIVSCKYQGEANLIGGVIAARNHFGN